ncbi:MAG: pyrroline-5-carboxylate reductase [bacterium]|nr:pyrroline-5-carboxylate reductase [bacterium]
MQVGIIGRGTLGGAIAQALDARAQAPAVISTTRASARENRALARASDVLLLCVKPHDLPPVLREIAPDLRSEQVVVSTAAGVRLDDLRAWSEDRARVVRAMPNTPARVGRAMTVIASTPQCDARALGVTRELFDAIGKTTVLDERLMDAVTAVSGCGPAYAFTFIEAMIDGALALGIPYDDARVLVGQTLLGSAQMLLASDAHPGELRHEVATPGGRTIRGLLALEDRGVRAAIARAVIAASVA